jgi:hypothetical protein
MLLSSFDDIIVGLYLFLLCGWNYMYNHIGIEGALPNLAFLTYLGVSHLGELFLVL